MTKNDIVTKISENTGIIKEDVYAVVQQTLDNIIEALVDGKNIEIRGFGVFEVAVRKSRIGRNPNKPAETFVIPERKVVKFKASKKMKEAVLKS